MSVLLLLFLLLLLDLLLFTLYLSAGFLQPGALCGRRRVGFGSSCEKEELGARSLHPSGVSVVRSSRQRPFRAGHQPPRLQCDKVQPSREYIRRSARRVSDHESRSELEYATDKSESKAKRRDCLRQGRHISKNAKDIVFYQQKEQDLSFAGDSEASEEAHADRRRSRSTVSRLRQSVLRRREHTGCEAARRLGVCGNRRSCDGSGSWPHGVPAKGTVSEYVADCSPICLTLSR